MDPIEQRVREFISKNFMAEQAGSLELNTPLLDTGLIDSIGLFQLVTFLEESCQVKVPDHDLLAENFQTIDHIVRYIKSRSAG